MAQFRDLIVTGSSRFLGKMFLNGGLDLLGDLDVDGNITGTGTLNISKGATITGGVVTGAGSTSIFNGNAFTVNPAATFAEDVLIQKGTLTIGTSSQSSSPGVGIHVHDLRSVTITPGIFGEKQANLYFDQINDSYNGGSATDRWAGILHVKGWTGNYAAWELAGNAHDSALDDTLRYRQGLGSSWGEWQSVLTDHNFKTYLDGTYAGLTYNNSFTGINKFAATNNYANASQVKFIIGNSNSAFAIGGDGLQCYSDLWGADSTSTTALKGKEFYINYYGGNVNIGGNAVSNLAVKGAITTNGGTGNITAGGNEGYITGNWLRSTQHTALDGAYNVFINNNGWLYEITQANLAKNMLGSAGNSGNPVYFTNGKPAATIWYAGNQNVGEHNANNVTYNFSGYYTSNGPSNNATTGLGATTADGSLWAQAYNSTWVTQLAQDYRNGSIFVRGKNNGTWTDWKQVPSGPAGINYRLPKYNGKNTITNSNIEDDGSLVTVSSDTSIVGILDISGATTIGGATKITNNNSLTITQTNGDGAGISLYGSATPQTYGMYFAKTSNFGYHGGIQTTSGSDKGDWATYFGMNAVGKRGWIYRAGTTNVASISANGVGSFSGGVGNGVNYIAFPGGGNFTCRDSSRVGAIAIKLPTAVKANCTMLNFTVTIYDYSSAGTQHCVKYHIGGYNYNASEWHQCEAYSVGDRNGVHSNLTVRFGHDGTREIIYIGETDTAWSYPQIVISDLTLGYSNDLYHNWTHGWEIVFDQTAAQNVTQTITNTYSGNFAGTDNTIAKFTNSGRTIINSKITDDGTNVSIAANLGVTGNVTLSNSATSQGDQPSLNWKTWNTNTPYFGFAVDQTDGTFVWSLDGENYSQGLAIGGGSGNLLWKAEKVAVEPWANNTFLKLTGGSINGNLSVSGAITAGGNITSTATIQGDKVIGAVWNDYAEYRKSNELEPGRVVVETGKGDLVLATKRLQAGANIISDTFGFAIGKTENCKCPIAVSGRVLAYPLEDRKIFEAGDPVCAGPNGTISKMTREEVREWPDRIIGTVSEIPDYTYWGTGKVKVNGRIWIKVK